MSVLLDNFGKNRSNRTILSIFGDQDNFILQIVLLDRFDCNWLRVVFKGILRKLKEYNYNHFNPNRSPSRTRQEPLPFDQASEVSRKNWIEQPVHQEPPTVFEERRVFGEPAAVFSSPQRTFEEQHRKSQTWKDLKKPENYSKPKSPNEPRKTNDQKICEEEKVLEREKSPDPEQISEPSKIDGKKLSAQVQNPEEVSNKAPSSWDQIGKEWDRCHPARTPSPGEIEEIPVIPEVPVFNEVITSDNENPENPSSALASVKIENVENVDLANIKTEQATDGPAPIRKSNSQPEIEAYEIKLTADLLLKKYQENTADDLLSPEKPDENAKSPGEISKDINQLVEGIREKVSEESTTQIAENVSSKDMEKSSEKGNF